MTENLHQLVYISQTQSKMDLKSLDDLTLKAQQVNQQNNITGLLVYRNNYFLQILEGDMYDVHYTFKKIKNDPRHTILRVLVDKKVDLRLFPNWNMVRRDLTGLDKDLLDKVVSMLENKSENAGVTLQALWTFYGQGQN